MRIRRMVRYGALAGALMFTVTTTAMFASPASGAAAPPESGAPIIICPAATTSTAAIPVPCCPPIHTETGALLPCYPYPCNIRISPYLCCAWITTADTTDTVAIPIRRCWPPCPRPVAPADDSLVACKWVPVP